MKNKIQQQQNLFPFYVQTWFIETFFVGFVQLRCNNQTSDDNITLKHERDSKTTNFELLWSCFIKVIKYHTKYIPSRWIRFWQIIQCVGDCIHDSATSIQPLIIIIVIWCSALFITTTVAYNKFMKTTDSNTLQYYVCKCTKAWNALYLIYYTIIWLQNTLDIKYYVYYIYITRRAWNLLHLEVFLKICLVFGSLDYFL